MTFKIYDCDFGIKLDGVSYIFTHVDSMVVEDPQTSRLTRGANASNTKGLPYKDGLKEAKKITVVILGMDAALKAVLDTAYENQSRLDVYCISRLDGSSKMGRDAILSQQPQQLTVDSSLESMNVSLAFETFDMSEVHKS